MDGLRTFSTVGQVGVAMGGSGVGMGVLALINEGKGCPNEEEYRRMAKRMLVEGAREFAQWCLRQPDDKVSEGIDSALQEFAEAIGSDGQATAALMRLPEGWTAIPESLTPDMLSAFQEGFMRELRKRKGRTESAEQAGLRAALKARPGLPEGWQ